MKAITLHKIDEELYKALVLEAKSKGWSLNVTAKKLLSEAVGIGDKRKKYRDLSGLTAMPNDEVDRIQKRIDEAFEIVDPED